MPDQGPVFQGDHPSNLIGWPTFQPSLLAGTSTVVNNRAVGMADLLIATIAEAHVVTLIHYDADFEIAAEVPPSGINGF